MRRARKWRTAVNRVAPWLGLAAVILGARGLVGGLQRGDVERSGTGPAANVHARAPAQVRRAKVEAIARPSIDAAMSPPSGQGRRAAFVDLFPRQDWAPPPPPPAPVSTVVPPPAQPPPLPFSIGALWLDGNGAFYAVLNAQGREFPLCAACRQSGFYREGDVLLGSYRIEKLTSREVRFLYLPMKRRQQMSLGG